MIIPYRMCRIFIWALGGTLLLLTVSSLTVGIIVLSKDIQSGGFYKLFQLLNLDFERNLPTWFSSSLLTVIALTLLLVTYYSKLLKRHYIGHWLFLSLIFFAMSMDEFIQFHEQIIRPTRNFLHADGLFYNAWIVPAGVVVAIVGLLYLRFIFSLPKSTRQLFMIAGFIYISAVLGAEAIGGYYFSSMADTLGGDYDLRYLLITHVEELLEMTGLTLFLYGLFQYLHQMPLSLEIHHDHVSGD
jgi:hypothetical protein